MRRVCGAVIALMSLVVAACGTEAKRAREAEDVQAAVARAETTAARAASVPSTGLWTEERLVERLVRAGVAPRAAEGRPSGPAWMRAETLAYLAGGGEVHAWIYADSTARLAVTAALDPSTATPLGAVSPYAGPIRFVTQNNLAAVVLGGSETNQDRIALALQAGIPVSRVP